MRCTTMQCMDHAIATAHVYHNVSDVFCSIYLSLVFFCLSYFYSVYIYREFTQVPLHNFLGVFHPMQFQKWYTRDRKQCH